MKRWTARLLLLLLLGFALVAAHLWREREADDQAAAASIVQGEAETSPTATATPTATTKPLPTLYPSSTAVPSPTPSLMAPMPSPLPSSTPTFTLTPFAPMETDELPENAQVPTPVTVFDKPDAVTNILLLGNDVGARQGGRTDSLVVVSIDEDKKTASLLSLPRDLYVVIPGWKMTRINQALPHGHGSDYPGGGGALVKDTILYNFGIPIDYYVRIGFDGFQQVVELLHGVDVTVSCEIEDWRLKEPELDPQDEESWEMFSLGPGIYHMHGDLALWYVRSRRTSSDFDRGRRQQQILRAILDKSLDLEMVSQLPELWTTYRETVETDLPLPVMIRLAALAPAVRENGIQHLFLSEEARRAWTTPGGAAVQLLQWEGAHPVLAQLMRPPILNRATRSPLTVEVVTPFDVQYFLAADNLAYHGFVPRRVEDVGPAPARTRVIYYGDNLKGSYAWLLAWILDVDEASIEVVGAETGSSERFRVVLGENYDPCRPQLEAPTLRGSN